MNRFKKEEQKKHHEARLGLTTEEVADLERQEAAKQKQEDEIREWHLQLFPEEYDFLADSGVEAKERRRGVNPMSAEYVRKTDERRRELGFAPYMEDDPELPSDTYGWVKRFVEEGRQQVLEELFGHWFLGSEAGGVVRD